MSELIEKMEMKIDQQGNVIPPETFHGNGKKNYMAHIIGRDIKYTWKRQWVTRAPVILPGSISKFMLNSFVVGEVYEFHASFLPTPFEESEMKKSGVFDVEHWKKDRMNRVNSVYNGFWRVTDINTYCISFERLYDGDMNRIFPKSGQEDEYQSSIEEFFGVTSGDEHIL